MNTMIGHARTADEIRAARFQDALWAFRLNTGLHMKGDGGDGGDGGDDAVAKKAADEKAAAEAAAKKAADDAAVAKKAAESKEAGYPPNTRVEDMKPEEQAAYYRDQARKHEDRNKALLALTGGKYGDELKTELAELAELRKAKMTDQEKAIAEAKEAAKADVQAEFAPKLASMAFDVALAHVPEEARGKLIDSLDLTKFVDPTTGSVDTDKVKETAELLAPQPGKGTPGRPDYGAGRRGGQATSGVAAGAARYAERHGKKTDA